MRWLAFGTYDVQAHPRVGVLLEGLADHGELVDEVVQPLGLSTAARVDLMRRPWRLPLLVARLANRWARLTVRTWPRLAEPYDAVLVGYLGHFDVLLARVLLTAARLRHPRLRRGPRPIVVLDHLASAAGTATDRELAGAVKTRLLRRLDSAALRAADVVLVDTAERLAEPGLPERTVVVPVGATHEWFAAGSARTRRPDGPLRVVFVGLFTPLQGTETIARALARLGPRLAAGELAVTMVGSGQDQPAARRIAGNGPGLTWLDWVPAPELPALVCAHDIGLGIFGTTVKARTVVPTKVFQAAAAGCVVVTSDTAPQRDSLKEAAVLVPAGDPDALADALAGLARDPAAVVRLRAAAFARAEAGFTPYAVVAPLLDHVANSLPHRPKGRR